ncbi:MAG: C10 family peptidase [Bacteroidaceae bacterium]|nr:C10 family peptidase [Bacteroidaceae bacterium]
MKHLFTLVSLFLVGLMVQAQTVTLETAQERASSFLKTHRTHANAVQAKTPNLTLAHRATDATGSEVYYYVFNNEAGGFVIVGGDDAAKQIIGYSSEGSFNYSQMPENMKTWLGQYDRQISHAIREVKAGRAELRPEVAVTRAGGKSDVAVLMSTQWNQSSPYNNAIPSLGSSYDPLVTGCVATAGAQVMKYYNYPTQGVGSNSYNKTWGAPIGTKTFEANFGATTYDWANMLDSYSSSANAAEKQAVATLMYHVGVSVNMNYGQAGTGGSSAASLGLGSALINNFKYDKGMTYQVRNVYTDAEWEDMVYGELAASRPVLYSGRTSTSGHAFVCDGYRQSDNTFHINWGWGGLADGYYTLSGATALTPSGVGIGGGSGSGGYNQEQAAIIGIQPDKGSQPVVNVVLSEIPDNSISYTLSTATVTAGSSIQIMNKIFLIDGNPKEFAFFTNYSLCVSQITYGVRLQNAEHSYDILINTQDFNPGGGPLSRDFTVPTSVAAGTYTVTPIYKDYQGNWKQVKGDLSAAPSLTVTAPTLNLYLTAPLAISNEKYAIPDSYKFTFTVKNNTGSAYNGNLSLIVFKENTPNSGNYSSICYYQLNSNFAANEEKPFVIDENTTAKLYTGGATIASAGAANYLLVLRDGATQIAYEEFCVTAPNPINYTLSSVGWGTICLPYDAEIPAGWTVYSVTNVNGSGLVKSEVTDMLHMNTPYLVKGAAGTYNFTGPITPVGLYCRGCLTGNTQTTTVYAPVNNYVLQNIPSRDGLAFYKVENSNAQRVKQYSAFLSMPSSASTLFFLDEDEVTAVESIPTVQAPSGVYYNIMGQQVRPGTKGIVISNGKKYLNK